MLAGDKLEADALPDMGKPERDVSTSLMPGPGGLTLQGRTQRSKVIITPEYSNQTGASLGAAFGTLLGEQAALGLLMSGGADKKELLLNAGFKVDERQRVILSAGQLQQFLDYAFRSGTEKVGMKQNSAAASYQLQLGQDFLRFLQVNGYTARTPSRDLADKTFAVDTATLYELWNDPRRIAGGKVSGAQGKLGFSPFSGSTVTLSLGYEKLSYDLLAGQETTRRLTTGGEWLQQLGNGYQLKLGAESFASQNRYSLGLQRSLTSISGRHNLGLSIIGMQGRQGLGNEHLLQLSYSFVFGTGSGSSAPAAGPMPQRQLMPGVLAQHNLQDQPAPMGQAVGTGDLLDQVTLRPSGIPGRVLAKVDTTALPTRLIAVDKTALPAGATVDQATGDVNAPLGVAVTGIAGVTLNLAPFANSGQFAVSGNTLVVRPSLMAQPAAGVTDSYVVTLNNAGGGITQATVLVVRGSVRITSISINNTADTTPDAFSFTDVTNQALSTLLESNAITVAGINTATAISVSGGEYQINGGAWTAAAGTVTNGQTVKVRHTTSASNNTATNTVLTIGGVADTFTSTTAGLPAVYIQQGGLTWMPNNIGPWSRGATDWNTANTYCSTATINGQTGWRLPTYNELSRLHSSRALDGQGWTLDSTWSSVPYGTVYHVVVLLQAGIISWHDDTSANFVTCVR